MTFINIDTKTLADQVKGNYYGSPKINDYLVGETSGAVAKVSSKDLVTDKKGNVRGSFFIDAPNVAGNLKFKTGTKLFRLSDSSSDSKVVGYQTLVVKQSLVHQVYYRLHKRLLYL